MVPITPRKQLLFIIALTCLVVAGCRSLPPPPVPATPTTVVTSTSVAAGIAAPLPSAILSSMTPTAITLPTPALDDDAEKIIEFITTTVEPRLYDTYPSPDGQWRGEVVIYACTPVGAQTGERPAAYSYELLALINQADHSEHVIATQFLYCGGLGAAGLAGLFWSTNSRYFYYTDGREGVPDGCGYWAQPIHRLEAQTLQVEELGGGSQSPDGTRYATWHNGQILLWDIDTGEIAHWSATVPDAQSGPMAWSPNGQALVYLQLEFGCPYAGHSYLVHIDLATKEQTLLLRSEDPTFGNVTWEVLEQLYLFDAHGARWRYQLSTRKLEQAP